MTNLELLAKLQGITLAELAEKIGCDRGNLRSSLQGKRPIPEDIKSRLDKILGVTDDGRLKTKHVHVWHIIPTGVRLNNIDDMREALDRLVLEKLIGPTWKSTSESGEAVQTTVLSCMAENGKIDPDFGPIHDPLFICLVQPSIDAVEIGPEVLWPDKTPSLFMWLHERYINQEDREPLQDQVIPAHTFKRIVTGRASFSEIAKLIELPNTWTWDRVVYFANQIMTAAEAAEKLGLPK